jgi:hypothetical protein
LLAGIANTTVTAAIKITPHSIPIRNMRFIFLVRQSLILLSFVIVRAVDFAVPLKSYSFLPLLDKRCPHISLIRHRSSRASRFLRGALLMSSFDVRAMIARIWLDSR